MKLPATPIALAAFVLGMTIVPAAAADRDVHAASPAPQVAQQSAPAPADVADAGAPNCLLPGHIRRFGSFVMVTPRRAVTLAGADCVARGGEPIASTAAAD
ncbi:MAG TPA: hypothetical protein VLV76_13850 [Candidatus Acidoferrum sp.]|nr:hypothetical protein [Candidatus Acidoferrum sp.]